MPFTQHHTFAALNAQPLAPTFEDGMLMHVLSGAKRGLLLVGELMSHEEAAAAAGVAQLLGWPVASDVLSGACVWVGARWLCMNACLRECVFAHVCVCTHAIACRCVCMFAHERV